MSTTALQPYGGNARTHSKKQIRQIADSIKAFGWTNPILIDSGVTVIAGAGRLAAARLLHLDQVPVIRIGDMTAAEKRAYILADNKLAENAGWDRELLRLELKGLLELEPEFEVTLTGFEMGEIDFLLSDSNEGTNDGADQIPEIDSAYSPVTRPGMLWQLGRHKLLCADATKPESFKRLMAGVSAQMGFTDPPYNVPIDGHVSGLGSAKHREFAMASGEMSGAEYTSFLQRVFTNMAKHSRNGAIHYIFMDWRHLPEMLAASRSVYDEFKNLCVWTKTNGGMGSLYRSQHELVGVFKCGSGAHINNVELGKNGRYRTNVWAYPGMNSFGGERSEALSMHPTVKPVALVKDAILDCSKRGGIVLDPLAGAGTTLIASELVGRRGFGLEIDPQYVDVTLRRFRALTGIEPVEAQSGRSFQELEQGQAIQESPTSAKPPKGRRIASDARRS